MRLRLSVIKQLTINKTKAEFFMLLKHEAFLKEKEQITEIK